MTTARVRAAGLTMLVCTLAPVPARAEFLVAPFFAWTRNPETALWVPGGGTTAEWTRDWLVVGGEVGYASGFFDPEADVLDLIASSYALTVTGHAGVGMPSTDDETRFLPYFTAGFGWMRQQARDREGLAQVTRNDPSLHFGGGVNVMLTEFLGVRLDLRNFRSLRDPFPAPDPIVADLQRVRFWRFALGGVIRFGTD